MIQEIQELMRVTLANSAAFRTLVGAADVTAALARIHHDAFPGNNGDRFTLAELEAIRPCAVVYTEEFQTERDAMGEDCWDNRGQVVCVLYRNVPEADKGNPSKVDTDFRTAAGNIISELRAMSETPDRLASRRFTTNGPFRTDPKELQSKGDAQAYAILVDWGVR